MDFYLTLQALEMVFVHDSVCLASKTIPRSTQCAQHTRVVGESIPAIRIPESTLRWNTGSSFPSSLWWPWSISSLWTDHSRDLTNGNRWYLVFVSDPWHSAGFVKVCLLVFGIGGGLLMDLISIKSHQGYTVERKTHCHRLPPSRNQARACMETCGL